jgi:Zn-dependent protease
MGFLQAELFGIAQNTGPSVAGRVFPNWRHVKRKCANPIGHSSTQLQRTAAIPAQSRSVTICLRQRFQRHVQEAHQRFNRSLRPANIRNTLCADMQTDPGQFIVNGVIWYIVFLFSTTCHEGAHALVAKIGGDPTAFHGGQVSLNPWPHIRREPIGTVVVPIISYIVVHWMIGWASAPYDPLWQQRYPRRAAWMALAGPAANFSLMILAAIAIKLGVSLGVFHPPPPMSLGYTNVTEAIGSGAPAFAATFLSILFVLNLLLGTFNLLPIPPLDGRNAITLVMSDQMALRFLGWTSQGLGMFGILIGWYVFERIFPHVFTLALNLLYPGAGYG